MKTQPAELTAEQKNQRIAEACGWTLQNPEEARPQYQRWIEPGEQPPPKGYYRIATAKPPNYFASLDACAEMRKALKNDERIDFINYLCYATKLDAYPHGFGEMYMLVDAAPEMHCEAFAKTLNLW